VKATNLAPQHPTAFLRVAILYGKQLNLPGALANFDRADQLYQALANYEGQAEVAYQRGYLFNLTEKKLAEARRELERSLELGRATNSQYAQVKALLKLGDVAAAEGDAEQGRQYIRQAIEMARANGIDKYVKRGLADLGNAYLASADFVEAEKNFKESLDLSQRQKDPQNTSRAWLCLASLADRRRDPDLTVTNVEQALPFFQQSGYRKETSQAFALLARAKRRKGDYDAALPAFEQQLKLAQELGDQSTCMLAHGDIGLVLMSQARYPEALKHFEQSYSLASASGNKKNVGLALANRANALWNLGRYPEAHALFTEASEIAERPDASKGLTGWYLLSLAHMALSERNFEAAKKNAQQALSVAGDLTILDATSTSGLAQAFSGATHEGRVQCEKAVQMAQKSGDPAQQSSTLLAFAQALLQNGDSAGALAAALQSQELFARMGNQDSEWIALTIAAAASRKVHDRHHAHDYAARAGNALFALQQKWGGDNYSSYLNRADVKFFRTQLNEILAQEN
jgi:tetratricopeptide (TPR) repeat protein